MILLRARGPQTQQDATVRLRNYSEDEFGKKTDKGKYNLADTD